MVCFKLTSVCRLVVVLLLLECRASWLCVEASSGGGGGWSETLGLRDLQDRVVQYVVDNVLQSSFTQQALDYANQKAMEALAAQIAKTEIPGQAGNEGHMHYDLHNMRITGFSQPSSSLRVSSTRTSSTPAAVGLTWSAANAGINLHADWRVKYKRKIIKISTSGSVDVSVSGASFSITVTISKDSATGKLSLTPSACTCSIGNPKIRLHGKLGKVLNLLRHKVERRVRDQVPAKVCQAVDEQVRLRADGLLDKVNSKLEEAYGLVPTIAVVVVGVIVVATVVSMVGLWCLSRIFSLTAIFLVWGAFMSVVLWFAITKGPQAIPEVPEILDRLAVLVS